MMRQFRPHRTGRTLTAACGLAFAACAGAQTDSSAAESERLNEFRAELERLEASVQALRRSFDALALELAESGAQPAASELPEAPQSLSAGLLDEPAPAVPPGAAEPDAAQVLTDGRLETQAESARSPAAEEAPRFVAIDPPVAMLRQGRKAFADHEFHAAEKRFREFLDRYPRHADALSVRYWLGETLYEQGEYHAAIEEFGEVLEHGSGPRRMVARLKTGYAWYELGEYEKAQSALAQVRDEDPDGSLGRLAQLRLERLERKTGAQ